MKDLTAVPITPGEGTRRECGASSTFPQWECEPTRVETVFSLVIKNIFSLEQLGSKQAAQKDCAASTSVGFENPIE